MRARQIDDIGFNKKQGSIGKIDSLNMPVPGHSLTDEPIKWPWDKPPEFTDPDEAVEFVADKIQKPEVKENFLRLMVSGISIEQIVNTIALGGFSDGKWSPDIAEVIKPPISVILIDIAVKNKIPVRVFEGNPNELDESRKMSPKNTLAVMKERNPEEFKKVMQSAQYIKDKPSMEEQPQEQGFIDMEQQEGVI